MPLYAVLLIPDFALQAALRHTPGLRENAVALIADKTPKARISQLTAAAKMAGVQAGMTPSQGQARCPQLRIQLPSGEAERVARATLLECALSLSPFVEQTGEGICTVRWEAGWKMPTDDAFKKRPLAHLEALSLSARLGIAPNPDLALLAAQGTEAFLEIKDARDLGALPLCVLAPPPLILAILKKWGIRNLGEFVALGRESLVERLGIEALEMFDRAAGRIERPLRCVPPPESFEEAMDLPHEIETLEPLLFVARRFLEALALRLEAVWLVAGALHLRLGFSAGPPYERHFVIPSPTRDVEVLFRILHTHLESFRAEHPIVHLHLMAIPSRPWRQQFGLFESALRDPNQFFETLARLGAILGHERVGCARLLATHRPDAFQIGPVTFGQDATLGARAAALKTPAPVTSLMAGLSLRRFRPARALRVRVLEGRPVALQSAEISGPIVSAYGPVLLSGEWWSGTPWNRQEWDVQLAEGLLCRIFEENGEWWLEGVYD